MANQIGVEVVAVGVAAFSRAMRTAQDDTDRLTGSINKAAGITQSFGSNLVSVGGNLQRLGRTMLIDVTAPIGILTGSLLNAGIQFENSFAGITKTVEGLAIGFDEIKAAAQDKLGITVTNMDEARAAADRLGMSFGELTPVGRAVKEEFIQMGMEIPIPTKELAALGEVVGQLGVEAPQIAEVTALVAKLGVATEVSAEDAAFGLIRMANIMGSTVGPNAISMEEFIRRAGSAVVDLGNKSVATEGQILDFALRLSAAGDLAGWSEQQVLAWSTTLADLGTRTESGATAVSRALNEMTIAVATGSDNLGTFAKVMGISSEEFAQAFKKDASATLAAFTKALGDGIASGKVFKDDLTDMGLGGVRAADVMLRLSDASNIFAKNLSNANTAWDEAIALEDEAEKKTKPLAAQIQILMNTFTALGEDIRELMEDEIGGLIDLLIEGILWFKGLDKTVKENVVRIAAIAAVIGPVLIAIGSLISLVGVAVSGFGALGSVAFSIIGPIGLIGAALLGLVAILSGSEFKLNLDFSGILEKAQEAIDGILYAFNKIGFAFKGLKLTELLDESGVLASAQSLGETFIQGFISKIEAGLQFIGDFAQGFADAFVPFVEDKGPQIERIFTNVKEIFDDIKLFIDGIGQDIAEAFGIDTAGTGVGEFFGTLAGISFEGLLSGIENVTGFLADLTANLDKIKNSAEVQGIITGIADAVTKIKDALANIDLQSAFSGITDSLKNIDTGTLEAYRDLLVTLAQINFDRFKRTVEDIKLAFEGFMRGIQPFLDKQGPKFESMAKSLGEAWEALGPLFKSIERLAKSFDKLKRAVFGNADWEGAGEVFGKFVGWWIDVNLSQLEFIVSLLDDFIGLVTKGVDFVSLFIDELIKFPQTFEQAKTELGGLVEQLSSFLVSIDPVSMGLTLGNSIREAIIGALNNALTAVGANVDNFMSELLGEARWNKLQETLLIKVPAIIQAVIEKVGGAIDESKTTVDNHLQGLVDTFVNKWNEIKTAIDEKLLPIKTAIITVWEDVKTSVITKYNEIRGSIEEKWDEIKAKIDEKLNPIKTAISDAWEELKRNAQEKLNQLREDIDIIWQRIVGGVVTSVRNMKESVKEVVREWVDDFIKTVDRLYNDLVGNSIIPDMINSIVGWFDYFKDAALRPVQWFVDRVRDAMWGIQNVLNDVKWAFSMLEWTIGNVVNNAKWYLDQLGSKVQEVLNMITGSPELKLQHPFELFENYLKNVDYGKLIESSMSLSVLGQLSTVPAATPSQGNTTNIDKGVTANISGVPMDTASGIVNVLNRQVRMSEAFQ